MDKVSSKQGREKLFCLHFSREYFPLRPLENTNTTDFTFTRYASFIRVFPLARNKSGRDSRTKQRRAKIVVGRVRIMITHLHNHDDNARRIRSWLYVRVYIYIYTYASISSLGRVWVWKYVQRTTTTSNAARGVKRRGGHVYGSGIPGNLQVYELFHNGCKV